MIADADGPARALAEFQLNTECRHLLRTDWEVDRAIELLYLGRDEEAAESCAYARRATEPRLELNAYEAILDRDPSGSTTRCSPASAGGAGVPTLWNG